MTRELVPLLVRLRSDRPAVARALELLRHWDEVLSRKSAAASIFEVWAAHLHKNVFALYVPPKARAVFGEGSRAVLIRLLTSPDQAFGKDPAQGRDALLLQSLEQAVAILEEKLGPDLQGWQWDGLRRCASPPSSAEVVNAVDTGLKYLAATYVELEQKAWNEPAVAARAGQLLHTLRTSAEVS